MQLYIYDSFDNKAKADAVLENLAYGITKIKVCPKLNDVTDMFTVNELTVEQLLDGTEIDFGTYGLFKNIDVTFYCGEEIYSSQTIGEVCITASEYNFAYLNATYPVLVASLKLNEITLQGSIPTFIALERNATYNWDELPYGMSCLPTLTEKEATEGGFHERRSAMAEYIRELYEISPNSHFTLYAVDNYPELIVEYLIANKIPEEQWSAVLLSDGAGTAALLSNTFNVDNPYEKYDLMAKDWKAIKEYYYQKGSFDTSVDSKNIYNMLSVKAESDVASVLENYAYVIAKEQDNVDWWVNRLKAKENLSAINEKNEQFTQDIISTPKSFYTNSLLATLSEEQLESFKKLYNFNGEMFSEAEKSSKNIMIILGTAWSGESASFYEYMKLTMKYYGEEYIYYYKGHPGYPTSLYSERQAALEQLKHDGYTLYELDNAIAAEVILFFYPDAFASGWSSTTFESIENEEKIGIIFDIPYAERGDYTYGTMLDAFATMLPSDTVNYGNIELVAEKTYCLLEYNNSDNHQSQLNAYAKHEIAIYNVTDNVIKYYKSTGASIWTEVDK